MKTNLCVLVCMGLAALLVPLASKAQSAPQAWSVPGGTDHYYEVIATPTPLDWEDANAAADELEYAGLRGHLVTITSAAENEFVKNLLIASQITSLDADRVWIGGFQLQNSTGGQLPHEDWYLLNGEGQIPPDINDPDYAFVGYENWGMGLIGPEPDDVDGENSGNTEEDYVAFSQTGEWYSESLVAPLTSKGYIVEYDTGRPGDPATGEGIISNPETECEASSPEDNNPDNDGCHTIPEQKLILPRSTLYDQGANIRFRSWRFRDPRVGDDGKCNVGARRTLDVFGELEPDDSDSDSARNGELVLQEFMCGSPYFAVVLTDAEGIVIPEGTVNFEHWRLQDNLFNCEPDDPNDLGDPSFDLQHRDTPVWRSIDPATTLEQQFENRHSSFPGAADGEWTGSVSERTTGCRNPSAGDSETKSFYMLGLHIDFGTNTASESDFKNLASYKLEMLIDSVDDAQELDQENDRDALRTEAERANLAVANDLQEAQCHVQHFLTYAENETEYTYGGRNDSGIHEARGRNALFLLEKMIRQFTPNAASNSADFVCLGDPEGPDDNSDSDSDSDADSDSDSDFWRKTKKK